MRLLLLLFVAFVLGSMFFGQESGPKRDIVQVDTVSTQRSFDEVMADLRRRPAQPTPRSPPVAPAPTAVNTQNTDGMNKDEREQLRADILARAKDPQWLSRLCQLERLSGFPLEDIYKRNPEWRGGETSPFGLSCR